MARTYEPIASTTLGSDATTITFSSIPGTYTDLRVVVHGEVSANANSYMRFNSDSGTNYSWTYVQGYTSASSGRATGNGSGTDVGYAFANQRLAITSDVMSYANTNVNKTVLSGSAAAADLVIRYVGLWRSTAAITRIDLIRQSGNWKSGTVASVYGIKAA